MIYLWIVSFIWAFSFGLIKTYLGDVNPYYLSTLRIGISFIFFLPLLKLRRTSFKDACFLIALGAIQFGLMYIFYLKAFQFLPAWQVSVFTITTPIFVSLIADLLKHKFRWRNLVTAILAVLGGLILKLPDKEFSFFLTGFLLVQASNLSFALGQVGYKYFCKKRNVEKDVNSFALLYLGGTLIAGLSMLFHVHEISFTLNSAQILSIIYLGAVASGLSFFLWNLGARKTGIGTLAIMNNMKIPLAILASTIIFKETLSAPRFLVGVAIICIGFIAQIGSKQTSINNKD